MRRPQGTTEKYIEELPPSLYSLGILFWIGNAGYFSHLLAGNGWKFWPAWTIAILIEYLLWRMILFLLHRAEFPWYYRKEHVRDVTVAFKGLVPVIRRKKFSLHQLNNPRRNPLAYSDPDRSY